MPKWKISENATKSGSSINLGQTSMAENHVRTVQILSYQPQFRKPMTPSYNDHIEFILLMVSEEKGFLAKQINWHLVRTGNCQKNCICLPSFQNETEEIDTLETGYQMSQFIFLPVCFHPAKLQENWNPQNCMKLYDIWVFYLLLCLYERMAKWRYSYRKKTQLTIVTTVVPSWNKQRIIITA